MQGPVLRAFRSENLFRTILLLLCAAALILFFGKIIADALGVVFVACALAFLVSPLAKLLEKKLAPALAAALALVCVLLALLAAVALLLPLAIRQLSALAATLPAALTRLQAVTEGLSQSLSRLLPGVKFSGDDLSGMQGNLSGMAAGAIGYVSGIADALYRLGLSAVLCCFLIADREKVFVRLELIIPSRWRRHALRLGKSLLRELKLYLRGQATIALCVGALAALGLCIIGVDGAILLGAFVGLLNMIPYFGPLLGGAPAVLIALGDGWQKACLAALVLFLVQQVDGFVISPRIMGSVTGFSPAVVLLALFCGAQLGGVWGLLLAMPALMAMRTLYRVFVQRHENN